MSEDEKKAIEIIKEEITRPNETALEVYVTDIKMLLHLIDKQQKEIESLKSRLDFIGKQIEEWANSEATDEIGYWASIEEK